MPNDSHDWDRHPRDADLQRDASTARRGGWWRPPARTACCARSIARRIASSVRDAGDHARERGDAGDHDRRLRVCPGRARRRSSGTARRTTPARICSTCPRSTGARRSRRSSRSGSFPGKLYMGGTIESRSGREGAGLGHRRRRVDRRREVEVPLAASDGGGGDDDGRQPAAHRRADGRLPRASTRAPATCCTASTPAGRSAAASSPMRREAGSTSRWRRAARRTSGWSEARARRRSWSSRCRATSAVGQA